jgi:hypothetical protein
MRSLQVALHAFGTKLPRIEWKIHPRFEVDHLIILDQQLDAALLTTKAAMGFYDFIWRHAAIEAHALRTRQVRAEFGNDRVYAAGRSAIT